MMALLKDGIPFEYLLTPLAALVQALGIVR
jgi:hypothetical protein